jgi:hypothetical protein
MIMEPCAWIAAHHAAIVMQLTTVLRAITIISLITIHAIALLENMIMEMAAATVTALVQAAAL